MTSSDVASARRFVDVGGGNIMNIDSDFYHTSTRGGSFVSKGSCGTCARKRAEIKYNQQKGLKDARERLQQKLAEKKQNAGK